MKIHGEQAAFLVEFIYQKPSQDDIEIMVRLADKQEFRVQKEIQKEKSQHRGRTRATKRNLKKIMTTLTKEWMDLSKNKGD